MTAESSMPPSKLHDRAHSVRSGRGAATHLLLLALVANSCGELRPQHKAFHHTFGERPVKLQSPHEYDLPRHTIAFKPAGDTEVSELIDLSIFGNLVPGMTTDEAIAHSGPPSNQSGDEGDGILVYERPDIRIEVIHHPKGSVFGTYHGRYLAAYPERGTFSLERLLCKDVRDRLPNLATFKSVRISTWDDKEIVECVLKDGMVDRVYWACYEYPT